MRIEKFVTVGASCSSVFAPLFSCAERNHVLGLRFNLSKFEKTDELEKRAEFIGCIAEKYPDFEIMIDVPFPRKKIRIELVNGAQYIRVRKQQVLYLCDGSKGEVQGDFGETNVIRIMHINFFSLVKVGQTIVYSDGECAFKVEQIDSKKNCAKVRVLNDSDLYTGKSISIENTLPASTMSAQMMSVIQQLHPQHLALSFVTDEQDVVDIQKKICLPNTRIISKIECEEGIKNIDRIAECSDIMMARGDLLLNASPAKLPFHQQIIANRTRNHNSRLYCATGIMKTLFLNNTYLPTQSDLNDCYQLLAYKPFAFIFNYFYPEQCERFDWMIKIIDEMESLMRAQNL